MRLAYYWCWLFWRLGARCPGHPAGSGGGRWRCREWGGFAWPVGRVVNEVALGVQVDGGAC
jgi:hypothetical protein